MSFICSCCFCIIDPDITNVVDWVLKNSFLSIYFCINFVGVNLLSSVPGVSVPDFIMFVLHLIWGKGVYQMPLFEQFVFT